MEREDWGQPGERQIPILFPVKRPAKPKGGQQEARGQELPFGAAVGKKFLYCMT